MVIAVPSGGSRNRKPTNMKVLHGTDRPDRVNANEPKPKPVAPKMPSGLDHYAKQAWQRLSPILERLALLTESDLETFVAYCEAYARYTRAVKRYRKVLTATRGDEIEHLETIRRAEVSVEKSEHSLRLLGNEFGLSPASRSRLSVDVSDHDEGVLSKLWANKG